MNTNPLTPTQKNSLIFVNNSEIIAFGPRSSKPLEFKKIFFLNQNMKFFKSLFFNSAQILMNNFCHFVQCKARTP